MLAHMTINLNGFTKLDSRYKALSRPWLGRWRPADLGREAKFAFLFNLRVKSRLVAYLLYIRIEVRFTRQWGKLLVAVDDMPLSPDPTLSLLGD